MSRDLSDDFADDIEKRIVQKGDKILNTSDTYRLSLRKKDTDFFRLYIQERGATKKLNKDTPINTDGQRHIRDNDLYSIDRFEPPILHTLKYCFIIVSFKKPFSF